MYNKVNVRCVTNLDDYQRVRWPTELCCKPEIGEKIQSVTDHNSAHAKVLKIVAITHTTNYKGEPSLELELHR